MWKWIALGLLIFLLTSAECQEPDETVTRKYQDELFKTETTETTNTDINTTLSSTEIENNSTTTESSREHDKADTANTLDENDELLNTHEGTEEEFTREEEVTQSIEWTTLPQEHEYSISIKDVFQKSIDVVKDEMKGIGIIQNWLKEQANDIAGVTPTNDYDYTQTTDEYTNDKDIYDDAETGVPDDTENEKIVKEISLEQNQLGSDDAQDESKKGTSKAKEHLLEGTDRLTVIEEDLEKLNQVQTLEENELKERTELLEDIEENLKKLEASSSPDTTTDYIENDTTFENFSDNNYDMTTNEAEIVNTTDDNSSIMDVVTSLATEMPIAVNNEPSTEKMNAGEITSSAVQVKFSTETEEYSDFTEPLAETTTIDLPTTITTENIEDDTTITINIINEIDTEKLSTVKQSEKDNVTINIIDERTDMTTEMKSITENNFSQETIITASTTTEVEQTSSNVEEIPFITQSPTNEENNITTEINSVSTSNEQHTWPEGTTLQLSILGDNSSDIVDEVVDEIIDELKDIESTSTTTEDATNLLIEETLNLTQTIDQMLNENATSLKVITSNSIQVKPDEDTHELSDEKESTEDISENEANQDIDKDTHMKSMEDVEEDSLNNVEKERTKILADSKYSKGNSMLSDNDHYSQEEEEVAPKQKVFEPSLTAQIAEKINGNVCLNTSGLSIKITNNNLTYWAPSSARVLGECTSFGAYLNFTWQVDDKENFTVGFTFIGDEEDSYIEEVIFKTKKENFVATQLEKYLEEPTIIQLSNNITVTMSHLNIKLNHKKKEYATIPLLSVDNALALQIASGGLCLFVVLIGVSIYSYRKLRSQSRIFKVSLDK